MSGQTLALSDVSLGANAAPTFGNAVNNGTLEFGGTGSVDLDATVTLAGGTARALNSMLPTLVGLSSSSTMGPTALLDTNAQNFIIKNLQGAGEIATSPPPAALVIYTGTYAGTISGNGLLIKDNASAGDLTLTGTNTYTGGTTITGGVLRLGNGGTTGTLGTGPVIDSFEISYNRTDAYEISQPIAGTGTLRVENSGTLTLSAASPSFQGPTQVDFGTLSITGSSQSGVTTVATNGTLKGTGVTNIVVVTNGAIRPGLSPGILEMAVARASVRCIRPSTSRSTARRWARSTTRST